MINNFDSFVNEEFLGIDLKKIKKAAYEYHKTKEYREVLESIDLNLLDKVVGELKVLKQKYGSVDNFANKLANKVENKNEGIISTVILTTFGIHAFLKLLAALKNRWTFKRYLKGLLITSDEDVVRSIRDLIISITFVVYMIIFTLGSTCRWSDSHTTQIGNDVDLVYTWSGIHDYKVIDSFKKEYLFKRVGYGKYDILYKGKLIGHKYDNIYSLSGRLVLTEGLPDPSPENYTKYDLEKVLTCKINKKNVKEIQLHQKEVDKLNKKIDSLIVKTYENLDLAKKNFKSAGIDFDKDTYFQKLKAILEENNNIGYLGFLSKLYLNGTRRYGYSHSSSSHVFNNVLCVYNKIKENKSILNQLRDDDFNLKDLNDFDSCDGINAAFARLENWKKINTFIRRLPSAQKRLIWENGWFKEDLKNNMRYLQNAVLSLVDDEKLLTLFLSKVSAMKTQMDFIENIAMITKKEPWDFQFWINKLNKTRNVLITWSSEKEKQIICVVYSYKSIKEIAYMTNWCITRSRSDYQNYCVCMGSQYILYDFNYDGYSDRSVIGITVDPKDNKVRSCHNKTDSGTRPPDKFLNLEDHYREHVLPEYFEIDIKKASRKFDKLFLKMIRQEISKQLSRPYISDFIDFYDTNDF